MTDPILVDPTPTEAPANDRRALRRQAIVETAARLFAELGYADCEMERIAAELRIAKGTLYLYFPSKQELFFASVDLGMRAMHRAVREAADAVTEPFEKIARAIRAYLEFFELNPHNVELLIQERAIFKDRKRPTYFEHRDEMRGPWRQMYLDLMAAGRIRNDLPVERILDAIGQLVYGTMFTNHFIGRSLTLDEQYRSLLEIVFRGILTDEERQTKS